MRIISICALSTSAHPALQLRSRTTKMLAFMPQVQENTKPNENDSHYRSNNTGLLRAPDNGIPTMIVCVYKELGVGTCCGKCVSYAREVMNEHLGSTTVTELRRAPAGGVVA
jgi:bacterioferritin-associated ferredoxin